MEEIEMLEVEDTTTPKQYLEKLIAFSTKATQENSIVYKFDIDNNYCHCEIIIYEINGSNEKLEKETFSDIEKTKKELIEPFLKYFSDNNKIVINNISPSLGETSNLKIISESNDMCEIHGMLDEDITRMSELVSHTEKEAASQQAKIDERGVGNTLAFVFSVLILGAIILAMLFPNFLK